MEQNMIILIRKTLKKYHLNIDVETIIDMWSEDHRGYHSISHLKDLINMILYDKVKYNELEFDSLLLTAIFHDIIYNPEKNDNEEQSAIFLHTKSPLYHDNILNNVIDMILATKTHKSHNYLAQIFNNYDMDIVNRNFNELLEWEKGIQKEYLKFYNKTQYKIGRIDFLKKIIYDYPNNKENLLKLIEYVKNM
jgi:pantetheine-phosphate adenylyltransferase